MKKYLWIVVSILVLGIAACAPKATPTPIVATPTPVVKSGVNASAVVVPVDYVELAFTTLGRATQVNVKVGDEVTAGQALVQLDTAVLEAQIKEAEFNLQALQSTLDKLTRNVATERDRSIAKANVDSAQARLDSIKAQLANSTLVSPVDGTVTAMDISVGETVTPGRAVITIANLKTFRIETTDLSEVDIPQVSIGKPAKIYIEALNLDTSGTVVEIAQQSETIGGDVVFKVTIELDQQPEGLRWGMSAEVHFEE